MMVTDDCCLRVKFAARCRVLILMIIGRVVEGAELQVGEVVGTVATVLAKDKGRPMSMLHLELYKPGTREFVEWKVEEAAPDGLSHRAAPPGGLLDPTPFLLGAMAAGAAPPPP